MFNRFATDRLQSRLKKRRLVVLTGARQTGKTTLVQSAFPDAEYISVEDPAVRPGWTRLSAEDWIARHPVAIVYEVQKAPSLLETLKAAWDRSKAVRYVLLGSSQILLLDRVRESLAGRAAIEELWPLTLPELATDGWGSPVQPSRLLRWLDGDDALLHGVPAATASFARDAAAWERVLRWGAMPALHDPALEDGDRTDWLRDYRRTYLERDVADLAALRDLEPFVRAQEVIAARTGRLANASEIARSAGVAPATAQRFLRYLELSYQVVQLQPWSRNVEKRLSKAVKVHFVDVGVLRSVSRRSGPPSGEEYESAVIGEIVKQLRTAQAPWKCWHLRTWDGREVDLLLESDRGYVAIEVKLADRVGEPDVRHLRGLGELLDKPVVGGLLISQDREVRELGEGIWAVPAAWVIGAVG